MSFVLFSFFFTAAVFGVPVPEDIAMITIAVQVKRGALSFSVAFAVCWGVLVFADSLQFTLGRVFGKRVLAFLKKRGVLTDERKTKIERRLQRWGMLSCFVARFIPGGRMPVFVLAGNTGVSLPAFLMVDVISTALLVLFWLLGGDYVYDLLNLNI